MSKRLVFINSLITLTLHDGNHLEFPVPKPEFFKGPKAMVNVLPAGNFEVPLATEEGKEPTILKGTAPEIVVALTKGFNPETVGKDGKLDGAKYSAQLTKLQSILAGKATKDETETGIVLNNAALITTIERALNPALDEQITAVEEASEEDANPYTIAINAITETLLTEETPSPEAAPEEVKAEAENASEPVVTETPGETTVENLPAVVQPDGGAIINADAFGTFLTGQIDRAEATLAVNDDLLSLLETANALQQKLFSALQNNSKVVRLDKVAFEQLKTIVAAPALPAEASK